MKMVKDLCTPAYVYFIISIIALVIIGFQNLGNVKTYCVGNYECMVSNTLGVFIVKALYIMFWTWILNMLCSHGYKRLAWLIFLLPFISMFILIALFMFIDFH
jgi:hypothetical protein